jgi:hypothetical protein
MEMAQKQLELLKDQSIAHLKVFGAKASLLVELVNFVIMREK